MLAYEWAGWAKFRFIRELVGLMFGLVVRNSVYRLAEKPVRVNLFSLYIYIYIYIERERERERERGAFHF
jgi:hypothetical protein